MGEFGPVVGVPRILNLLRKYDIKGCFFIPGETMVEFPDVAPRIFDEGHEIGFPPIATH
jgi:peptidoglycan/xylan/chitin deacetylase (PgdA/CDA1 family)